MVFSGLLKFVFLGIEYVDPCGALILFTESLTVSAYEDGCTLFQDRMHYGIMTANMVSIS